jgi:Reverse transcriptase (RNA-dependent DNA polymerase).
MGFTQSKVDRCLYYKKNIFLILYVDDCGISYKHEEDLVAFISELERRGFKLTQEGTFAEFLGIKYRTDDDGNIHLSQEGLIKKILETTGLTNCKPNKTPGSKEPLGLDPDGPPMRESWSYPSVVGMLLYLSTNCHPDISYYYVSSVARFTHNPKQSHAAAVKTICHYLKGTICEGTIIRRSDKLSLECFCDADFAGLYNHEPHHLSSSVMSRGAYIIKLSGCPLIWKSQLMPSICLSTAEAEYYSLSNALRALIPAKRLIEEMVKMLELPFETKNDTIRTTVHEDNQAALSLAVNQRITSRTRHYLARWHFFWEIINDPQQNIDIVNCPTDEQEAAYLTKGLDYMTFI